jgi:hypothetical protein
MLNIQSLERREKRKRRRDETLFCFFEKKRKEENSRNIRLSKQTAWPCDLTSNKQHQSEVMDHILIRSRHHPVRSSN